MILPIPYISTNSPLAFLSLSPGPWAPWTCPGFYLRCTTNYASSVSRQCKCQMPASRYNWQALETPTHASRIHVNMHVLVDIVNKQHWSLYRSIESRKCNTLSWRVFCSENVIDSFHVCKIWSAHNNFRTKYEQTQFNNIVFSNNSSLSFQLSKRRRLKSRCSLDSPLKRPNLSKNPKNIFIHLDEPWSADEWICQMNGSLKFFAKTV